MTQNQVAAGWSILRNMKLRFVRLDLFQHDIGKDKYLDS